MYSRVTSLDVLPDKMDELLRMYEEIILPRAKKEKGFRGGILLRDPENNKALLITTWETRDDMMTSERSGFFEDKLSRMKSMLSQEGSTSRFESDQRE